jgi:hypothetical protein
LNLLRAIAYETPPAIESWRGCEHLPEDLNDLILGCLAKDPDQRPQSVERVAEPLLKLVEQTLPDLVPDQRLHQDVQFTAYRPKTITRQRWSTMLAFAHHVDVLEDDPEQVDPIEEVRRQAERILGENLDSYRSTSQDTNHAIPDQSLLTFVPEADGVEFNPASRSFHFNESVHREEFRVRARTGREDTTARGRLNVFLGNLLIAEVPLAFRIIDDLDGPKTAADRAEQYERQRGRRFTQIYASCCPEDAPVVGELQSYIKTLGVGCRITSAATHLRNDSQLDDQLRDWIRSSDVFQLFWSSNSMRSSFARSEWEYAISLQRDGFVRPVYWEEPLPADPNRGLPPEDLRRLTFTRIYPTARQVVSEPDVACFSLEDASGLREADTETQRAILKELTSESREIDLDDAPCRLPLPTTADESVRSRLGRVRHPRSADATVSGPDEDDRAQRASNESVPSKSTREPSPITRKGHDESWRSSPSSRSRSVPLVPLVLVALAALAALVYFLL